MTFGSDAATLRGWLFPASGSVRRGLIVYLHGSADNRVSGVGIAQRFGPRGYDVFTYDSRAHGASGGDFCTYGYHERRDVALALDALDAKDAVLFGSSLGAAVALQAAAFDPRIRGVIAQSPFADLRLIIRERARGLRLLATAADVEEAISLAERRAGFRADEVSPRALASRIHAPVLLIHGLEDRETAAAHSQSIYEGLAGPRKLVLVPGAGHNDVLGREESWREIETFMAGLQ